MKIDFYKIRQVEMTMQQAADQGLFAAIESEWSRKDWEGRLPRCAQDTLRVYYYGKDQIGWIQDEIADFNTLTEWLDGYKEKAERDALRAKFAREDRAFCKLFA